MSPPHVLFPAWVVAWLLACSLAAADAPALEWERITAMDRWLDLAWRCGGDPPEGFAIAVGGPDQVFSTLETAPPGARTASVYITPELRARLGPGGDCQVRLTARLGAGPTSTLREAVLDQPRDTEAEVRQRFQYWDDRPRPYHLEDPVYPVIYLPAECQRQRAAASAMWVQLLAAAGNPVHSREFTIPPGIYRVDPDQLRLRGVQDFTIRAPGVEIIVDGERSGAAFVFEDCSRVVLTGRAPGESGGGPGLVVDSQQLPMSVARIVAVDPAARTLDVEIQDGYVTDLPDAERMLVYDPQGRMLNTEQMGWQSVSHQDDRIYRLGTRSLARTANQGILVPGNLLALHSNPHHTLRSHGAVASRSCRDMTYETIRIYTGGGAPADHRTGEATIYRDWRLLPRPGTNRLAICTGLGQFSKEGGTFLFEDCEFGPHLDDGINLLSGMSVVGRNDVQGLVVTGHQEPTPGSTLTFHDGDTWAVLGEARVVESARLDDPVVLAEVNAYAKSRRIVQNARTAYRVVLDRPVATTPFAVVVHSDHRADGITVRGCLFRDQLAQIMLIQGAKSGLIENNLLLRSAGGGVSAQFAQYWWEGPMPSHLVIRNNVFRDNPVAAAVNGFAGNGAIAVFAGTTLPTTARLLRDFRMEGNLIINPSVYGIVVRNAAEVVIRHNRIINPGAKAVEGSYQGRPISGLYAAICLDAVSGAEVSDNEFIYANERCRRGILVEATCDPASVHCHDNRESEAARREGP